MPMMVWTSTAPVPVDRTFWTKERSIFSWSIGNCAR